MKILLGEISSYKAIVIAEYLKSNYNDIFIFTYDYLKYTSKFRTKYSDRHFCLEASCGQKYIDELAKICINNEIDFFIPIHSDNIGAILNNKKLFGNTLNYIGNYNDYLTLHNKDELQSLARGLGIDTPVSFYSFNQATVPFVLKPNDKSSAKGVIYFKSEKEKTNFNIGNLENFILQEYIEGFGCGYSVFVENGKILVGYGHKRIAEFPVSGGSSVYRTSFFDSRMQQIAEKIFEKVPWSGFAMIEFKYTPDNRLVLIEVNPRIWLY